MRQINRLIITFIASISVQAQYDFEHADCKIRYSNVKDNPSLTKVIVNVLKKKKFKPELMIENSAVIPGDTYYTFDKTLEGKLYKTCTIHSFIKIASSRLPRASDKILYQREVKRSLPRITFSGGERCRKALQETFIHIPRCKPIGFAGERN
jgi:hypothetical protein